MTGPRSQRDAAAAKTAPATNKPQAQSQRAGRHPPVVVCFLLAAAVAVAADLATKHWAFAALMDEPNLRTQVIPGVLDLRLSTNPGVVFGIRLPPWLVLGATGLAVVAVAVLFAGSPRRSHWLHAALAMVLAGAIGNAYDRLFSHVVFPDGSDRSGQVRDFIDVHAGDSAWAHWPTFNLADVFLVVGVAIILIHSLRQPKASA